MRITAEQCHPDVSVDRAMARPVSVILFGRPGMRLTLSTDEAIRFANQLVDAAEQADAPEAQAKPKRRRSTRAHR